MLRQKVNELATDPGSMASLAGTRTGNNATQIFEILIWVQADHENCMRVPVVLNIFE